MAHERTRECGPHPPFSVKREHTAGHISNMMRSRKRAVRWASPHVLIFPCVLCLATQSCPTPCNPMDCSPPGSSVYRDSPGKNAGVGCPALLQGIFPSQGLNPRLLHCTRTLYHLSHMLSILRRASHIFPSLMCTVLQSKAPSRSEMLPGTLLTRVVPLGGTTWGEFSSS